MAADMDDDVDADMTSIADVDINVADDMTDDVACRADMELMWMMTWPLTLMMISSWKAHLLTNRNERTHLFIEGSAAHLLAGQNGNRAKIS